GLRRANGGPGALAGLADDEVLLSEKAAGKLDARAGDTLTLYVRDTQWQVRVAGIVQDELASGVTLMQGPIGDAGGLAMPLATAQRMFGHPGQVNAVTVALNGGVRGSVTNSDAAASRLEDYL